MTEHVYCRMYGIQYRLKIVGYDMSVSPTLHEVCRGDFLKMLPYIQVGAAYATYTPFKVLRAAVADFKVRKIERVSDLTWRYEFETLAGIKFCVNLERRQYDADRYSSSSRFKGQSAKALRP